MPEPIMILADDYRMASDWAYSQGLKAFEWRFISHVCQVLGRHGGKYVTLTRGELPREQQVRRDYLLDALLSRMFEPLEEA